MKPDDFERQAELTIGEAAKIPDRPVGSHLSDEQVFEFARGTLAGRAVQLAFAHLESCADCAERAEAAFHDFELARRQVEEWLRAAAVAVFAVRSLRTRSASRGDERLDWQTTDNPAIVFALSEVGRELFLCIGSSSPDLSDCPIRCVLRDERSGEVWTEVWMILTKTAASAEPAFRGKAPLFERGPRPESWRASVERYELTAGARPTHVEIERLRSAIGAADQETRAAWRRWLDAEVTAGRMTSMLRDELLPAE